MKTLILGAGATGGYFGGRMAAGGADVTFLVRPGRAATLARDGLVIESPHGDWRGKVQTVTADILAPGYDAVILSCKAFDLDNAIAAVRPAVGPQTVVLPLLNGLNHLGLLDQAFGPERVLGGLCHISVTLGDDGHIKQLTRNQLFTFGPRSEGQKAVCERLLPELQRGGFAPVLSAGVLQDLWEKFVFLTSLAGITCLMRASVGEINRTNDGRALALAMLEECTAVAAAAGHRPRAKHLEMSKATLTDAELLLSASMRRDLERGGKIEGDHIVGDMLARAKAAGLAAPLLMAAYCHLQCFQSRFGRPA
jgi:2-dehydropantoate 2-reductase